MARPISVTDEEILDAAQAVLERDGAERFSVSQVANQVGLTRTAVALRFRNTDYLRELAVSRMARSFEERIAAFTAAPEPGAKALLRIAQLIGSMTNGRERFGSFMTRLPEQRRYSDIRQRHDRRTGALRELIGNAMPQTRLPRADAIDAFMAHMLGTLMIWQSDEELDLEALLHNRTLNWLRLAGIDVTGIAPDESQKPET